jgi:Gram-negative bacterial tonB protein.
VEIIEGSGSELLDNEAKKVVSSSPKWTPGKKNGKAVKVTILFPVIFALR